MKRAISVALSVIVFLAVVYAVSPRTYQVTGPVLAVTPDLITVQKDQDKWEIQKTPSTTVVGTPVVGSRVTIEYKMVATKITVK
jgi:hypothetical protein